ncbi:hypothetical protein [Massilia cavernae]|uniref:hypothetical protein n=1 Tax=Massilia cavernae TaxID=2320864 RepID=UPI0027D8D978|nr:hypothetical protein [Massilia cavernae]
MNYLNDHLVLELPEASDHGQVLARIRLFDETHGLIDAACEPGLLESVPRRRS